MVLFPFGFPFSPEKTGTPQKPNRDVAALMSQDLICKSAQCPNSQVYCPAKRFVGKSYLPCL